MSTMPGLSESGSPPAKIHKGSSGKRIVKENQNIPELPRAKVRTKVVKETKEPKAAEEPKAAKEPKKRGRPAGKKAKSKRNLSPNPPATSSASTSKQQVEESAVIAQPENINNEMESVPSQNNPADPPQNPNFEVLPQDANNFQRRPVPNEFVENILLYRATSPEFCLDPRQPVFRGPAAMNPAEVNPPATLSASTSKQLVEESAVIAQPENINNEMESMPSQNNPADSLQNPNFVVLPQDANNFQRHPVPNEFVENVLLYRAISPEFCLDPRQPAVRGPAAMNPAEVNENAQRIYERLVAVLSNFAIPFPNAPVEIVAEPPADPIEEEELGNDARHYEDMLRAIVDDVLQSLPKEELDTYASGVEKAKQLLPNLRQRLYLVMRNVKEAIMEIGRSSEMHGRLPHSEHFNNSLKRLESVLSHIEIELTTVIECLRQHSLERGLAFLTQAAYIEAHEEKYDHLLDIRLKYGMHMRLAPFPYTTVALLKSASVFAKFRTGAKLAVEFVDNMQQSLNENKTMYTNWDE